MVSSLRKDYFPLLTGLLCFFLFFINLNTPPIYILDEAKNAQCAREMLESDNWIVPVFNGELRTDKPPFHYFMMMLGYAVFGVNEFAARFFSAVFGSMTVLATYFFTRRFTRDRQTALLASVMLLASLHWVLQMRLAVPDPYLVFFITGTLFAFYVYYQEKRTLFIHLAYLLAGLGILSKGPVAVVLPGASILLFLLFRRELNWKTMTLLTPLAGILIILLITLPWYVSVHIQTDGEWTRGFFIDHNLNRYADPKEGHGGIFLLTPLMVLLGTLPFSLFSIQATGKAWKEKSGLGMFCISVIAVVLVFFMFAETKLPNYTVPCYPFLSILLAVYLNKLIRGAVPGRGVKAGLIVLLALMTALPAGVYFALRGESYLQNIGWVPWCFILLPAGALAGLIFRYQKQYGRMVKVLAGSWILTGFLFQYMAYPAVYKQNPVQRGLPYLKGHTPVAAYKLYNPAFNFYLAAPLERLRNPAALEQYLEQHPRAAVITRESYLEEEFQDLDLNVIFRHRDVFELPTTVILTSRTYPFREE